MVSGFECDSCHGLFKSAELKAKKCPKDDGSVKPVMICDKTGFGCSACGMTAKKKETCRGCKKMMEGVNDRTAVNYNCSKCNTTFAFPGNCKECGKKLRAKCSKDGKFPHGGESKNCK